MNTLSSLNSRQTQSSGSLVIQTEKSLTYVWLTLMWSNSRSVSTLTDWLMIRSREELALCADSSLPCGSHCLQRSTKDLQDTRVQIWDRTLSKKLKNMFSSMMNLPERRAAVDQSDGPGNISVPSVSKLPLSLMKHLHLPLETGQTDALWKPDQF